VNKRRLLKLADLLEADANNKTGIKFDMGDWIEMDNPKKPISCGTTACAMGLAALSGAFKRAGLGYKLRGWGLEVTMHGKGNGLSAAMALFEIEEYEAAYLFIEPTGRGARGERKIANLIRKFVARGGIPHTHESHPANRERW
jgi:hypothetical protein